MAHDDKPQRKWEGAGRAELRGPKAEQMWPLLEDFGLHKWLPTFPNCFPVQGVSGQPGCVRYLEGIMTPADRESNKPEQVNWCKQQLLSIDSSQMTFSYSIIDGNMGFNSYIATMRVLPEEEGWTLKDLDMLKSTDFQAMASRMEASLNQH